LKLSGPVAQPVLENVTYDEMGAFAIRQKARIALDVLKEQQAAAERQDEAQQEEQEQAVTQAVQDEANPSKYAPNGLTMELVAQALLPVRDQLIACLKGAPKPTFQARTLMVVEDGKVLSVSILPAELHTCLEPLIKAQPFPKTKSAKREQIT